MTTVQARQAIRAEAFDSVAMAREANGGKFQLMAQFSEFTTLMEQRAVKASAKAEEMKTLYVQIDSGRRRNRHRGTEATCPTWEPAKRSRYKADSWVGVRQKGGHPTCSQEAAW